MPERDWSLEANEDFGMQKWIENDRLEELLRLRSYLEKLFRVEIADGLCPARIHTIDGEITNILMR